MGLYEVHLCMSLLGFRMGTVLDNFHMCCIMLLFMAVLNMLVGPMCYRCLMFSLAGSCELLFCFITLSCGDCYVVSLYFLC